jgi:hypothetical protein
VTVAVILLHSTVAIKLTAGGMEQGKFTSHLLHLVTLNYTREVMIG